MLISFKSYRFKRVVRSPVGGEVTVFFNDSFDFSATLFAEIGTTYDLNLPV